MHNIITIAIIILVLLFAVVLAKGTSLSAFLSDAADFMKKLFRRKPSVRNNPEQRSSPGTTGLPGGRKNNNETLSLIGRSAKSGMQTQITVFDHGGSFIGTKTVYVDDNPLLIGRGTETNGYGSKLCLPDITEEPMTSRTHCILENDNGNLVLRDCYDQSVAFDSSGNQIHSVSVDCRTNEYVGNGFVIDCGGHADVDVGDYVLKIKNLSSVSLSNVPTYGRAKFSPAPTKDAVRSAPPHVPTREFKVK